VLARIVTSCNRRCRQRNCDQDEDYATPSAGSAPASGSALDDEDATTLAPVGSVDVSFDAP